MENLVIPNYNKCSKLTLIQKIEEPLSTCVIPNYNKCSKLTLTQKIEEPLSTRVSACSEVSIYIYCFVLGVVVGLVEMLGWAIFYCIEAQVFWVGESGLVQLELTLVWLAHKLSPFLCRNFDHMPLIGVAVTIKLWQADTMGR